MTLLAAIDAGDVDAVRAQVDADPSVAAARSDDGVSAVRYARYRNQREIVAVLLAARPELDVFDAATVGDVDRLAEILDADPAALNRYAPDGFFPLALAAHFGQPEAVRVLLDRGANVHQAATNDMQVQALHAAVAGRNYDATKALLEAGADPNAVQHGGWTPLMAAEEHEDTASAALLLQFGATPTSGNRPTTS